jgi:hypothetical protein
VIGKVKNAFNAEDDEEQFQEDVREAVRFVVAYRKQFGIPSKQSLTARSYSESRRKSAIDRGLGDVLAKARETRAANIKTKKAAPAKTDKTKVVKKAAPAKTAKAVTPKVAKKTDLPF